MRSFFAIVLILLAIGAAGFSAIAFLGERSAIHEIEGLIGILIVAVCAAAGYLRTP